MKKTAGNILLYKEDSVEIVYLVTKFHNGVFHLILLNNVSVPTSSYNCNIFKYPDSDEHLTLIDNLYEGTK